MQSNERDIKLAELASTFGLDIQENPVSGGLYEPVTIDGNSLYLSGQIPKVGDAVVHSGKVGQDVSLDDAKKAAALCALRAAIVLKHSLGSLAAVEKILRINVFVQGVDGFSQQTQVADGASELLRNLFGEAAGHARSAVGVAGLPRNAAVELDMIAVRKQ